MTIGQHELTGLECAAQLGAAYKDAVEAALDAAAGSRDFYARVEPMQTVYAQALEALLLNRLITVTPLETTPLFFHDVDQHGQPSGEMTWCHKESEMLVSSISFPPYRQRMVHHPKQPNRLVPAHEAAPFASGRRSIVPGAKRRLAQRVGIWLDEAQWEPLKF